MDDNDLFEHEKKSLKAYTDQALGYDSARFENFQGKFRRELVFRILDEWLDLNDSSSILDVATGTGVASLYLAETRKNANVIGIDLTEGMLDMAREKAKEKNIQNIDFQIANARELPFEDNTFDAVVSLRLFHHIPNKHRKTYLDEMRRVLKPGGIVIVEFKNLFYGLVCGLIMHFILGIKGGHYLWPHQVPGLFKEYKIKKIIGLYLPLVQKIARHNKKAAFKILSSAEYFPINFLSSDSYIICTK